MQTQTVKKKSSYREPLILIAFVIIGAVLGLALGEKASVLYPIGQIWLNLLFVLLVPLIFFSIAGSIANISDTKRVGKLLVFTIGFFIVTAAIAGIYMFAVTGIFGVDTSIQIDTAEAATEAVANMGIGDQIVNTFTVDDFPLVISRAHILALIVFTVFFGVSVSLLGEQGKPVASWLSNMSLVFYKMVSLLMKLAPIGLMAYFANLTGTYGPELLKSYARGLLIYYPATIVYFFVFLALYAFLAAGSWGVKNFFKNILTPALTALGTRSSAAAIPLQLDACDKMGVPRDVSSVVIPVGATCHMDGACIATIYEIALCCALFSHPLNSIGDYSLAHNLEDAETALDFILSDEKYGFDRSRIYAVGHSLGGFVCGQLSAKRAEIRKAVLMTPCDIGRLPVIAQEAPEAYRIVCEVLDESGDWLNGTSGEALLREATEHSDTLRLESAAPGLASKPVLCIGGTLDIYTPPELYCEPLRRAVEKAGGTQFRSVLWPTDHFLSDYRLTVSETVLEFLEN